MNDQQQETGRDLVECLDGFATAVHELIGEASRTMDAEAVRRSRESLERSEMKIMKLKIRFPETRR